MFQRHICPITPTAQRTRWQTAVGKHRWRGIGRHVEAQASPSAGRLLQSARRRYYDFRDFEGWSRAARYRVGRPCVDDERDACYVRATANPSPHSRWVLPSKPSTCQSTRNDFGQRQLSAVQLSYIRRVISLSEPSAEKAVHSSLSALRRNV
jgi:hypothetical protein